MIGQVSFTREELLSIQDKYNLDENRALKAIAYAIHTRFSEENNFTWREKINHLKWVREKLKA